MVELYREAEVVQCHRWAGSGWWAPRVWKAQPSMTGCGLGSSQPWVGVAALAHRGAMLSLHPWADALLVPCSCRAAKGQRAGHRERLGEHLMRCITFSRSFSLLWAITSVFVSNTATSDCCCCLSSKDLQFWTGYAEGAPKEPTPTICPAKLPLAPPVFKTQMLWRSSDGPQKSNLKSWSDRESVSSSGKLFHWLINYFNCSAPRPVLFLWRNAFGFQPLDLKMPLSARLLLLSLWRHLLTTLKSPLNLPRDRLNGFNICSSPP